MTIDRLVSRIIEKKNPSVVGIDPEWSKIPDCYKKGAVLEAAAIKKWAIDVIEAVSDVVPAVKPQMAFFEIYGSDGVHVHQEIVRYAHEKDLIVIDDSKRNDIGNTARAYAQAHLAKDGPINADFLTVSPFLGTDSLQPFVDVAIRDGKGIFVLVKTSNPSSYEISEAVNRNGEKISHWLAGYVHAAGQNITGKSGYSFMGAVVGATFPDEAKRLRQIMKNNFFLVPGFGAQGGGAKDIVHCFNDDGLGAVVNSSRGILYHYQNEPDFDGSERMYMDSVRNSAIAMRDEIYSALRDSCAKMCY